VNLSTSKVNNYDSIYFFPRSKLIVLEANRHIDVSMRRAFTLKDLALAIVIIIDGCESESLGTMLLPRLR